MREQTKHHKLFDNATFDALLSARLWWTALAAVVFIAGIVVFWMLDGDHASSLLIRLQRYRGPMGYTLTTVAFALACVAFVPVTPLIVAIGVLYGGLSGILIASIGATAGAAASFLIARYLARDATALLVKRAGGLSRLNELIRRHGIAVVAFVRVTPLFHFGVVNCALGLTSVRTSTFVVLTWLCMLPGIVLYAGGGGVLRGVLGHGAVRWWLVAAMGAAVAAITIVARTLRARIRWPLRTDRDDSAATDPRPPRGAR